MQWCIVIAKKIVKENYRSGLNWNLQLYPFYGGHFGSHNCIG